MQTYRTKIPHPLVEEAMGVYEGDAKEAVERSREKLELRLGSFFFFFLVFLRGCDYMKNRFCLFFHGFCVFFLSKKDIFHVVCLFVCFVFSCQEMIFLSMVFSVLFLFLVFFFIVSCFWWVVTGAGGDPSDF